jgi:hypothetical protein
MTITIYGDVSRNHSGTISCVRCGTCLAERKYLKAKQDRTVTLMNNLTSVSSNCDISVPMISTKILPYTKHNKIGLKCTYLFIIIPRTNNWNSGQSTTP